MPNIDTAVTYNIETEASSHSQVEDHGIGGFHVEETILLPIHVSRQAGVARRGKGRGNTGAAWGKMAAAGAKDWLGGVDLIGSHHTKKCFSKENQKTV